MSESGCWSQLTNATRPGSLPPGQEASDVHQLWPGHSTLCPDRVLALSSDLSLFFPCVPNGWQKLGRHLNHNLQVTGCQCLRGTDLQQRAGWAASQGRKNLPFCTMLLHIDMETTLPRAGCSNRVISADSLWKQHAWCVSPPNSHSVHPFTSPLCSGFAEVTLPSLFSDWCYLSRFFFVFLSSLFIRPYLDFGG